MGFFNVTTPALFDRYLSTAFGVHLFQTVVSNLVTVVEDVTLCGTVWYGEPVVVKVLSYHLTSFRSRVRTNVWRMRYSDLFCNVSKSWQSPSKFFPMGNTSSIDCALDVLVTSGGLITLKGSLGWRLTFKKIQELVIYFRLQYSPGQWRACTRRLCQFSRVYTKKFEVMGAT